MKYLILTIVVMFIGIVFLFRQNYALQAERDRQSENVEALMGEVKHYKVNDSLNVASVYGLQLTVDELKQHRAEDARLIKELKLRPKDVDYITNTKVITRDSLVYRIDSVGCFHYKDNWLKVDVCIGDNSMIIESRDSITQVVHVDYKHRFLWWRWGVKSIRQEVVNFNPRSTVEFSEIIKVSK